MTPQEISVVKKALAKLRNMDGDSPQEGSVKLNYAIGLLEALVPDEPATKAAPDLLPQTVTQLPCCTCFKSNFSSGICGCTCHNNMCTAL